MRVKEEYKYIEDAMDKKRGKNKLKQDRYTSQRQLSEQEKKAPDVLKLKKNQLPKEVLQKIDKLINERLKSMSIAKLADQREKEEAVERKETTEEDQVVI